MANLGNIAQASGEITGALAGGLIQSIPQIFTAGAQLLGADRNDLYYRLAAGWD